MVTGEQIRVARERMGETQAEFGERFGVTQPTVHNWEKNGAPTRGAARKAIDRLLAELSGTDESAALVLQGSDAE